MEENKIIYVSFLDSIDEKGGGHIETIEEINQFQKIYGNIDIACINSIKNNYTIDKGNRFLNVKNLNKFIPIFGKRPFISFKLFSKYKKVLIADSRCFVPFLMASFLKKDIYFKSHGSLAIYFWSYIKANLFIFKWQPIISFIKIFYYLILIIIFSFIETYIYIFSKKIYMMRSQQSFRLSFWGAVYCKLFGHKTEFSFCPSLNRYKFMKELNYLERKKKDSKKLNILIFGNWQLPHNFSSLIDFIERLNINNSCTINIVGKIDISKKEIINKLDLKNKLEINILGYIKNLDKFKLLSTHVVSCANYGSGIPIKCLEIIIESDHFNYIPMASSYCMKSLKGILDIEEYIFPPEGPITIRL